MNEQNLKPRPFTSGEQAQIMGRKGGSKITPAKSIAAKLRELKKKGLTDENAQHIYELMTNSELSELDILIQLEKIRSKSESVSEKREAARLFMEWYKLKHGDKIKIESTSKSINLDLSYALTADDIARITKPKAGDKPTLE